jgi:hypothetical protein
MPNINKIDTQKTQIGILEINRHIPVLYSFLKILSTPQIHITIFTTPPLYKRLQTYLMGNEQITIILQEKKEKRSHFLKRVETYTNEHLDVLLVNTIHEVIFHLLPFLHLNPEKKMILTIHHVNTWLKQKIVFKPLQLIMTIETNIATFLIKGFILKKYDALNVIYKPLKDYIQRQTTYEKPVFTLPTSVYDPTTKFTIQQKKPGILKTIIPGLIQEQRKDYTPIIEAIKLLPKNYLNSLEICIPGFPVGRYGRKIHQQFKALEHIGAQITLFNEFVPDDIFDQLHQNSDIIICPIRIKTRSDNLTTEFYGTTVGSGVIYNGIQYIKPLIVPQEFNQLPELLTSTLTYKNPQDLSNILIDLIDNPEKLQNLKNQAKINAEKFSITNLQQYVQKTIIPWITENK